jgi:SAM-dependent methyltransferase
MSAGAPRCAVCGGTGLKVFYTAERVPVYQNFLMPTRAAAQACERGDIALAMCDTCGFMTNLAFQPDLVRYSRAYENAQSYSPSFRAYMEALADRLIARHGLRRKTVLEVGCGKGEFLTMLCERGPNDGVGFDPSLPQGGRAVSGRVTLIADVYSERYAAYRGDLVCSRHVLEHLQDPAAMLKTIRRAAAREAAVYVEVPDVMWILRHLAFWDLFYEHCSYFSPPALRRLFAENGFAVTEVAELAGGQYLGVEAVPIGAGGAAAESGGEIGADGAGVRETAGSVARFVEGVAGRLEAVRGDIEALQARGRRAVVWGAGAKGVTFLNRLDIGPEAMPYVVDINPRKQGMYVPGTGQEIVSPEAARAFGADVVLVMNPNYDAEIRAMAREAGISAEFMVL